MRNPYRCLLAILILIPFCSAHAELRTLAWWDPDGVGSGEDWHYRIPFTLPASSSAWTNDGSDPVNPLPNIPDSDPAIPGVWTLRADARDVSTSTSGSTFNGFLLHPGRPSVVLNEQNYWNIGEGSIRTVVPDVTITKLSFIIADPVSGSNFKAIPGAVVHYCLLLTNNTPNALPEVPNNVGPFMGQDMIPGEVSFNAGSIRSGPSCGALTNIEDDDADDDLETDPVTVSYDIATGKIGFTLSSIIGGGQTYAIAYNVTVK